MNSFSQRAHIPDDDAIEQMENDGRDTDDTENTFENDCMAALDEIISHLHELRKKAGVPALQRTSSEKEIKIPNSTNSTQTLKKRKLN